MIPFSDILPPLSHGDAPGLKARLMAHAANPDFILFDSNALHNPGHTVSLDWMIAWGCRDRITQPGPDLVEWETFLTRNQGKWSAGILGYDLYHCLPVAGGHAAQNTNTSLCWWVPEHLVVCAGGQLYSSGAELSALPEAPAPGSFTPLPLTCTLSREAYLEQVKHLLHHIHRGDIYEVNYCIEFSGHYPELDIASAWQRLMQTSPNPFSALVHTPEHVIFSASPERFLHKQGPQIRAYPMKGTRRRWPEPEADAAAKTELQSDAKERSENIMIVDLVRNDLSRTALPGTVRVDELCEVYTFANMHQMISTVSSEVPASLSPAAVVRSAFPMGSMTGAPKVKAIELIHRYEGRDRGYFSGSIGYVTPANDMDLNVVIRSLVYHKKSGYLSLWVGSAITALSDPEREYEECMLKAAPILRALGQ